MQKPTLKLSDSDIKTDVIERLHCPDCAHYIDGVKQKDDNGKIIFSPVAGMQFRRKTYGTIYERIGALYPCTCPTGRAVRAGYDKGSESTFKSRQKKKESYLQKIRDLTDA